MGSKNLESKKLEVQLNFRYKKCRLKFGGGQGGIQFEILSEPNFPINNFAQNSGEKLRHRPDNNKRKVVTKDKTGQKYSFIQRKNVGQSGQIGTMHQKLLI